VSVVLGFLFFKEKSNVVVIGIFFCAAAVLWCNLK